MEGKAFSVDVDVPYVSKVSHIKQHLDVYTPFGTTPDAHVRLHPLSCVLDGRTNFFLDKSDTFMNDSGAAWSNYAGPITLASGAPVVYRFSHDGCSGLETCGYFRSWWWMETW